MFRKYIGDRAFYSRVLGVALPIMIQNAITNFVSMLDNIMVGQIGTLQMSGVSIANQLMFVFNLCIFGACSGAGIFTAQFHGSQDEKGIRHTFRFKLMVCLLLSTLGIGIFLGFGSNLIGLYLQGEGDPAEAAATLGYGMDYLKVMLWGLLPFAICNAYSGTLRETGQTVVPMAAGIAAVFVNLILNYVLIFGHFGAPAMGVEGAALATVISRLAELAIVSSWVHLHKEKNPFIRGAYKSPYVPLALFKRILTKGTPLLMNEFLWSTGMAMLSQCYSTCGLNVVPATNISNTLYNLGSVAFLAMGNSVGIIMGQLLGANTPEEEVRSQNRKLLAVSVVCGMVFGLVVIALSPLFPRLYNTDQEVRDLATKLLCISGAMMPFAAHLNATYFTLRSGGKTFVTFLFDSGFMWVVCVPIAYCLSRFTGISILPLYAICQATDWIKCLVGTVMLRRGTWIQNLTN